MNSSIHRIFLLLIVLFIRGPLAALIWGYVNTSICELLIHKYIFHGHWRLSRKTTIPEITTRNPLKILYHRFLKFLNYMFHPFYVQHWLVHHKHVRIDSEHISEHGFSSRDLELKTIQQYPDHEWGLNNTSMGIRASAEALFYQQILLFFTPFPYFGIIFWYHEPLSCLIYFLPSLLIPFSNTYHKYLHMNYVSRRKKSPWYFNWLLNTAEGSRIAKIHFMHHHTKKDANWNLIFYADIITDVFWL